MFAGQKTCRADARVHKQRGITEVTQLPPLGNWIYSGSSAKRGNGGLPAGSPAVGTIPGHLSCASGTWPSCSLNAERSHCRTGQGAGGREDISIHCTQLSIWKSTSNVSIHIALLHFSTFMSVIAFIFLIKTVKQVII